MSYCTYWCLKKNCMLLKNYKKKKTLVLQRNWMSQHIILFCHTKIIISLYTVKQTNNITKWITYFSVYKCKAAPISLTNEQGCKGRWKYFHEQIKNKICNSHNLFCYLLSFFLSMDVKCKVVFHQLLMMSHGIKTINFNLKQITL